MKELEIQKLLRSKGLEWVHEEFKLNVKPKGGLVLLKYDQIESPRAEPAVQECRGIILKEGTWEAVSMPFRRFFNLGEGLAADIEWSTAKVFKKYDGSLCTMYHHGGAWNVSTSGTVDAMTPVNNREDMMFADLFWKALEITSGKSKERSTACLDTDVVYMTELCTPYNIVVTPHAESRVYLLGARDMRTLEELGDSELEAAAAFMGAVLAESYPFGDAAAIEATFADMPFHEEGYVVRDARFNRIKLKNPAYLAAHHLKGSSAAHRIMTIIKAGETHEYIATFPERREEILDLEIRYVALVEMAKHLWTDKLNSGEGFADRKSLALAVKSATAHAPYLSGLYFSLADGKTTVDEYFSRLDDRALYDIVTKNR